MAKLTKNDLHSLKAKYAASEKNWIKVGFSTCGIAAGAQKVYDVLCDEARKNNAEIEIKKCGCVGMCSAEPLVEVNVKGLPRVFYGKVDRETAIEIMEKHVCGNLLVNDRIYDVKVN
ncbi:MAG TPA: (2Fe-2S) ferredoxin domain-containing protein [Candidatus Omnitrophota bacterium]|jgi:(2Fe-2S) ferredoxin|nr:MAG: NADP-reducing hydrogenase subunit HndB [Candidatus Omnitrophica bacterium ADurb.Bin314]HOE68485.1 (2Fe-2S) ferredoxin domain-containing protein [Candidatus Omnitrophota bacterium]HQB94385.1 (2Fe-2S) ferredoxin domain-containing protein [Candidatus Omnitrophota bacterium]